MLDVAKNLPDDPSELRRLVTLLARELRNCGLKIAVAALEKVEPSTPEATAPEENAKPRRKPLPDRFVRHETVIASEDACAECGGNLKTLSEDITEELEYIRSGFVVNRFVRPRMACSCRARKFANWPSLPSRVR